MSDLIAIASGDEREAGRTRARAARMQKGRLARSGEAFRCAEAHEARIEGGMRAAPGDEARPAARFGHPAYRREETLMFTRTTSDPFREMRRLHREMNRLTAAKAVGGGLGFPAMNVHAGPDGVAITAEVPGVAEDDLEISVQRDTVTLKGERRRQVEDATACHRRERGAARAVSVAAYRRGRTRAWADRASSRPSSPVSLASAAAARFSATARSPVRTGDSAVPNACIRRGRPPPTLERAGRLVGVAMD